MTSYLRKFNIIKENGITNSRQKKFALTEKGNGIAKHLGEIKKIMEGGE